MESIVLYVAQAVLVAINLVAFFVMGFDKRKSAGNRNTRRIPEGHLFFLATVFGSVGMYVGMQVFRHKTQKWYFQIGIPLLILQNLVTVYMSWNLIFNDVIFDVF